MGLAYLHLVRPDVSGDGQPVDLGGRSESMMRLLRDSYRGTLLVCGGFDRDSGEQWLREGRADAIVYGRHFLANPDLPERLREGAALNADDRATYYGGGEHGYTDYPTLAHLRGAAPPPACVDERWR